MAVVIIIGLLTTLVARNIFQQMGRAQNTLAGTQIEKVSSALEMYKLDNFYYPSTQQGLEALVTKPSGDPPAKNWRSAYIKRLPKDPWGNPYRYLQPGNQGSFDVYSLGADNKPGGEGVDADIGNWNIEG